MTQTGAPLRPLRSALICHAGDALNQEGISRWLASFTTLALQIEIEEPRSQLLRRIRKEVRRSGVAGFADVLAFRAAYRLRFAGPDARWRTELLGELATRYPDRGVPQRLPVRTPNIPEVIAALQEQRVDFVLARCKTLLKPELFNSVPGGVFVLHPGICPQYRNAHGGFWALASHDRDNVGTTLLRIDAGVDTGPVYGYFRAPFDELTESHLVIQDRSCYANLDAIATLLQEVLAGRRLPLDTAGLPSRAWGQPRLTTYLAWKRAARRARRGP
ncbi:MAG TPA: formyltransferase family protein [Gemmatimonadales bacterium]|nr:formyltransferase family protein [Gemmatimonadales bacterium]